MQSLFTYYDKNDSLVLKWVLLLWLCCLALQFVLSNYHASQINTKILNKSYSILKFLKAVSREIIRLFFCFQIFCNFSVFSVIGNVEEHSGCFFVFRISLITVFRWNYADVNSLDKRKWKKRNDSWNLKLDLSFYFGTKFFWKFLAY